MSHIGEILEALDGGFAVESHMQAGMIIMPEPAVKCFLQILSCVIVFQAVELFFVGLVTSFDFSVETRGSRGDKAMRSTETEAGGSKRVGFDGAIQRSLRSSGIPMGENGIIVGLNHSDGKGKSGEDKLGKGFGDMDGHFFAELNEAEAGAAIDGGILEEASPLDEVRHEFDIDLDQISGARDDETTSIAFGFGFVPAGQAFAVNDFGDGWSRGKVFEPMVLEKLKQTQGTETGFSTQLEDPSAKASFQGSGAVIRTAGMIEQRRAVLMSSLETSFPFVEGLSRDAKPFTSQGDIA